MVNVQVTYSFRDNLLLGLSNLKGNPEMTQKSMNDNRKKPAGKLLNTFIIISHMMAE